MEPEKRSLYERVGGSEAVKWIVNRLYDRMLADPRMNSYFKDTDVDALRRHQQEFITQALGGPAAPRSYNLKAQHENLNIPSEDFYRMNEHFMAVLDEMHVDIDVIGEVISFLEDLKPDIVTKRDKP